MIMPSTYSKAVPKCRRHNIVRPPDRERATTSESQDPALTLVVRSLTNSKYLIE